MKIKTARKNIASGDKREDTAEPSLCSLLADYFSLTLQFSLHFSPLFESVEQVRPLEIPRVGEGVSHKPEFVL